MCRDAGESSNAVRWNHSRYGTDRPAAKATRRGVEADLALFISNALVSVPGVDYVGPVPSKFQKTLVFAAAVGAKAKKPAAATVLIQHLTTPAAAGS